VEKDYGELKYVIPYKEPLYAFVRLKPNGLIQIIGKQSEYVGNSPMELHWEHYASPQISYRELWMNGYGELCSLSFGGMALSHGRFPPKAQGSEW